MKTDLLIVGPLPQPVNGCSLANKVLLDGLSNIMSVDYINTSTNSVSVKQGNNFSISKALEFILTYKYIYKIIFTKVVYFTPGQTFFGVLKYFPFALLALICGRPYIVHLHGGFLGEAYRGLKGVKKLIFYFFFSKAKVAIVLSESLRSNFDGLLDKSKIYVVENFAGDEFFLPLNFIKKGENLRIIYLSNLLRTKGIIVLLQALRVLQAEGVDFDLKIAGLMDEEVKEDFYKEIDFLGNKAHYIGAVYGDEKVELLKWANIFVLPTYYEMEGQPISIIEAMASGNIIVSTKHAGIPDIVKESNGYLIDVKDSEQLAKTLKSISLSIEEQVAYFSKNNLDYASQKFKQQHFVKNVKFVFDKAVS